MQLSNSPGKLVLPFASSGNKNAIPVNSQIGITPGAASLADGFPPLTMTPVAAGGVPPSGLDMNGILYEMSAIVRWANAGGGYPYDADFATSDDVAGYPKGARVLRADGLGYWFNTVDNNETNPDAGGAGWVPDFASGATTVQMSSANVTLTPAQYGIPIIIITGTLTSNLNLIFPTLAKDWIVINKTTGGFSITGKTAIGNGVVIFSGVDLIVSDGVDVYRNRSDFSVKNFGAVGDGVADDTQAFQTAVNVSRYVTVPSGTYRLTAPLLLNQYGQQLVGLGNKANVLLSIDHVSGAGIVVSNGQCVISNLRVRASDARQSHGGSFALVSDLFGIKVYSATNYLTQCLFDRLLIERHPNHGFYMGGEGAGTVISQCESYYNRGHGYAFDDKTIAGGSSSRCGIVTIDSSRALDNGGNAVNVSQIGSTCYRFIINNLETIWNAWNTSIASLSNSELYIGGENHKIQQSAFADILGDSRTAMNNGDARLAKVTLSRGIFIRGSSNNIILENNRFISTSMGVETESAVKFLNVDGAYFTKQQLSGGDVNQTLGFKIGVNYEYLNIRIPSTSDVTTIVDSDTAGGKLSVGADDYYIYGQQGSALTGVYVKLNGYASDTIVSESINAAGLFVNMGATGVTNLRSVHRAGSANPLPAAFTFNLINTSAHVVTVKHGTAVIPNIRTKSGGDVILNPNQMITLVTDQNGSPYEV